jgi:hypothetical protein
MMSARRLALSLVCAASFTTALATASPALAAQSARLDNPACGATADDVSGTFSGVFDNNSGDTLSVTFTAPASVTTNWTVQGWAGSGKGTYEIGNYGPDWTNSDIVSMGPVAATDSEHYTTTALTCAGGDSQVTGISGFVDSGTAQIPFTLTSTGQ